jgi:hypothetical protein
MEVGDMIVRCLADSSQKVGWLVFHAFGNHASSGGNWKIRVRRVLDGSPLNSFRVLFSWFARIHAFEDVTYFVGVFNVTDSVDSFDSLGSFRK